MTIEKKAIVPIVQQLVRMVAYFDIFKHPLRFSEIEQLTGYERSDVITAIEQYSGLFACNTHFVWLQEAHPDWHDVQKKRDRATSEWPKALRYGARLAKLPFVKGVFLTGSMSKGAVSEDSDFDYLLVAERNRVWLVKSMIEAFRKALPQAWRECYCANYIVGMDTLELQHRNVFTAIELSTAIPLFGSEACQAFVQANSWAKVFVPNQAFVRRRAELVPSKSLHQEEQALLNLLDAQSQRLWNRYWEGKYKHLPTAIRQKRFRRERGKAANHLHDFQDRVIQALDERLVRLGFQETLIL